MVNYFPDFRNEIQLLLLHDQNFIEVASDYVYCRNELTQLKKSESTHLIDQYYLTIKDLEEELLIILNNANKSKSHIPL